MKSSKPEIILTLTIALGAFLSFSSEPLIGRLITPYYGGAVHVWTVAMMVFQLLLLCGYLYAHWIAPRLGKWHIVTLCLPLFWLPLDFRAEVSPTAPIAEIVIAMLGQIAVPFFALTTTAVVLQTWFTHSKRREGRNPYSLYSASNIGSLGALLAYPFLIEPFTGLSQQRVVWSGLYLVFIGLMTWCWIRLRPSLAEATTRIDRAKAPAPSTWLKWIAISATPSALLLAVTNTIASEVGSFPMVWVLPLALYLSSFIIAFRDVGRRTWSRSVVDLALLTLVFGSIPLNPLVVVALLACFFGTCVTAHKVLFDLRPDSTWLTHFYVAVSLGGWLGGLLISIFAPMLFSTMIDLPVSVVLLCAAAIAIIGLPSKEWWKTAPFWKGPPRAGLWSGAVIVTLYLNFFIDKGTLVSHRNFYGVFEVRERVEGPNNPHRLLAHGKTIHGIQYLDPQNSWPSTYYHKGGPIHDALVLAAPPLNANVSIIGLGTGALAYWNRPGDHMVFYEIDPDNERLARDWFTFLDQAKGDVSVRVGDARLVLETEAEEPPYDTILLDAFSGDGVPMHLITEEAFQIYLSRLTPKGMLIFHISNRYYDLRGVVSKLAHHNGLDVAWRIGAADESINDDPLASTTVVMAASRDSNLIDALVAKEWHHAAEDEPYEAPLWTDNYTNILLPLYRGSYVGF